MKIPGRLKYHHRSKKETPNHRPLIINISQHHHHISQNFLPKHTRNVTNTSLENSQNITKKPTKQHPNNTETSPKKQKRDQAPRHDRDCTWILPK